MEQNKASTYCGFHRIYEFTIDFLIRNDNQYRS
jgi:hypothetical protein